MHVEGKEEDRMKKEENDLRDRTKELILNSSFFLLPLLAHQFFGEQRSILLDELNTFLAAERV